ncbi:hypothetical protein PSPO01_13525 [Paraphaeosphaeria sporulosa]
MQHGLANAQRRLLLPGAVGCAHYAARNLSIHGAARTAPFCAPSAALLSLPVMRHCPRLECVQWHRVQPRRATQGSGHGIPAFLLSAAAGKHTGDTNTLKSAHSPLLLAASLALQIACKDPTAPSPRLAQHGRLEAAPGDLAVRLFPVPGPLAMPVPRLLSRLSRATDSPAPPTPTASGAISRLLATISATATTTSAALSNAARATRARAVAHPTDRARPTNTSHGVQQAVARNPVLLLDSHRLLWPPALRRHHVLLSRRSALAQLVVFTAAHCIDAVSPRLPLLDTTALFVPAAEADD